MPWLDEYLRIAEAAEYLGVCQNTLNGWVAKGRVPVLRDLANGYLQFSRSDLEQLFQEV
ncbi:MAG TPA: helix-turn-helix domain-containing protein [Thermoguttaceae bacterium]|nr:helix-turn-helix domain-containing protein [Thermoguttaceae bacterium]